MENVANHEDWKVCFSAFGPGLLLFARQWVRSPADAEDIVQDAFVKLWRRSRRIDNGAGGSRATWTGKPERVDERGRESINDGLIAESKGHFDSAEYERQLKDGVSD